MNNKIENGNILLVLISLVLYDTRITGTLIMLEKCM